MNKCIMVALLAILLGFNLVACGQSSGGHLPPPTPTAVVLDASWARDWSYCIAAGVHPDFYRVTSFGYVMAQLIYEATDGYSSQIGAGGIEAILLEEWGTNPDPEWLEQIRSDYGRFC